MSNASAAEVVIENTKHQRGFFHPLTETGQQFIEFCRTSKAPVLDVGAGNGVATLPALAQGSRVIAMDIESAYLAQLEKCAPPEHKARLRTIVGAFPAALSQVDEPIGAALLSFVIGFLSRREITAGLSRLFTRMARGGRILLSITRPTPRQHKSIYAPITRGRKPITHGPGTAKILRGSAITQIFCSTFPATIIFWIAKCLCGN